MLPEQQQRILGYFIEEARDHLNTIEQGLLNLQSTLNDPELINEVFRAAHSIKGGAAMLGLTSIQHTAHRLEDCFKVLKENPIQVDQKLESLFLGVSDTLKALLEQLSGPFGLSEETANTLMSETEPVFQWLNQHLELLVQQADAGVDTSNVNQPTAADSVGTLTDFFSRQDVPTPADNTPAPQTVTATGNDRWSEFQAQVLQTLREMLQLFKQPATSESRQNLQQCCQQLVRLGQTWNLSNWCNLCKAATTAIGNTENSYIILAKIVITEIKQAQELVLQGRETDITISQQLEALWDSPNTALIEVAQELLGDVPSTITPSLASIPHEISSDSTEDFARDHTLDISADRVTSLTEVSEQLNVAAEVPTSIEHPVSENETTGNPFWENETTPFAHSATIETNGPEVGLAELNTLADLFEGETPELDESWQQDDVVEIADSSELGAEISQTVIQVFDNDIADFLSLEGDDQESATSTTKNEDFGLLFGEHLSEPEKSPAAATNEQILPEVTSEDDINDFLTITAGDGVPPSVADRTLNQAQNNIPEHQTIPDLPELNNLSDDFDNLFIESEINTGTFEQANLTLPQEEQVKTASENLELENLFGNLETDTQLSANTLETVNNLFDEQPITVIEFTAPDQNLDDVYTQENSGETEQLLSSVGEHEIGKELEESLFAAAGEIFPVDEDSNNLGVEAFGLVDLDTTFFQSEEDVKIILTADLNSTSLIDTHVNSDNSQVETPELSQNAEVLEFMSDLDDQLSETSAIESAISFAELDVDVLTGNDGADFILGNLEQADDDLFHSANNLNLHQEQDAQTVANIAIDLDTNIEFSDIDESGASDLAANLLAIQNELPTTDLEAWAIPISQLTDIVIDDINDDVNQGTIDKIFDTPFAETPSLDFGDLYLSTPSIEITQTTIQDIPDNLNLDNELLTTLDATTSDLDFGDLSISSSEITQTTIQDIPDNLNLDNELLTTLDATTSDLDFGDLSTPSLELTQTTIQDIPDNLNLDNELLTNLDETTSDLDFGDLSIPSSESTQTTTQDIPDNLNLDNELLTNLDETTSDLDFGDLSIPSSEITQTTIQDIPDNLNLDNELLTNLDETTSNLDFGDLSIPSSESTQTTIQYIPENFNLDDELLTNLDEITSDLDFGGLSIPSSESTQTTQETSENINLDMGDELLNTLDATTSDLDFGDLSIPSSESTQTTIQDIPDNLNLDDELLTTLDETTSDLDFGDLSDTTSELTQTTTQNPSENINLDMGDELLSTLDATTSDLDFDDLSDTTSELTQTTTQNPLENINLDMGDELLSTLDATTSDLDFGDLSTPSLELTQTTIQDIPDNLNLDDELLTNLDETTSDLDFGDLSDTTIELTTNSNDLINENLDNSAADKLDNTGIFDDELGGINSTHETDLVTQVDARNEEEFADLEALLEMESSPSNDINAIQDDDFAALEALLGEEDIPPKENVVKPEVISTNAPKFTPATPSNPTVLPLVQDDFRDLEQLLAQADQTISQSTPVKQPPAKLQRSSNRRQAKFEETMKVPVKQLDDMSNLVGELVVNRNTLEQDHERLRQSLDNLLVQVQQLSDVGARMQELYERSLLESSLLRSRKARETSTFFHSEDSDSDRGFSELEMDRFTPFHTLSQEMIELIVRVRESASDIDFVTEETERVARQFRQVTSQLQEGLTRARMVPFSQTIDRLRRGVRDNAIKYGKQVELMIEGGDTLIDKMILDHLTDPLTHMLNNAIAHGIETPDIRQASGKVPGGTITIRAFHQGNQTVISVGDDGAGIDTDKIKALALKRGLITQSQAKAMSRLEIYDLLFQAGFSTKDEADEISGRGVGMDVVRSEISEIRGIVNTDSTLGKGTTFTIRLPLTLSICKALCCVSDKARVAFPMDGVEDTLDIPIKNIQKNAEGQSYISWRDTVLPFRPLKELLTFNRQLSRGNVYGGNRDDDMVSVVVVRSANTLLALQIDQVLSEQEIVIKQFEGPAPKPIGVAGATVLGDGRIMPIADVLELIDIFQGRMSKHSGGAPWQQASSPIVPEVQTEKIDPTVLIVDDSITVRELLSLTFNKAGYRVEQARDGQEAWDKLRSGLPCDIVFCDIEMPRCDGLELLSRIQKDPNLNHLPIAMLTSRGADKHRQMAIQLGASGYFTKPYLEEALLEAAVRMLKGEKLVSNAGNG
ncbi:response regulator [Nostoc sp. CMAA1605]|uniref:response regulator n=1 Tax=Nostoc sp. CMAA1605 TaxID=2055159 RepID=UPI001F194B7E|nr:response regulator [Nostoc sp. CMAA1605]MCF4966335.1 two-component hybrid sensor and regulator [Nostoc sp. CMAA1605]